MFEKGRKDMAYHWVSQPNKRRREPETWKEPSMSKEHDAGAG